MGCFSIHILNLKVGFIFRIYYGIISNSHNIVSNICYLDSIIFTLSGDILKFTIEYFLLLLVFNVNISKRLIRTQYFPQCSTIKTPEMTPEPMRGVSRTGIVLIIDSYSRDTHNHGYRYVRE